MAGEYEIPVWTASQANRSALVNRKNIQALQKHTIDNRKWLGSVIPHEIYTKATIESTLHNNNW
jgi:hypothetical protein